MERLAPGRHSYHEFPNYGHQDVFMGKNVAQDVFPTFVDWMREHSRPGARSVSVSGTPAT
jgi:cholesterol oxidase